MPTINGPHMQPCKKPQTVHPGPEPQAVGPVLEANRFGGLTLPPNDAPAAADRPRPGAGSADDAAADAMAAAVAEEEEAEDDTGAGFFRC